MNIKSLIIIAFSVLLSACSVIQGFSKPDTALQGKWQVEEIDQMDVIGNSMITVDFSLENKIAGSAGCNRYTAGFKEFEANRVEIEQGIMTKMACIPDVAKQEQRFLKALTDINHFEVVSDTQLIFYDNNKAQRLKLRQLGSP